MTPGRRQHSSNSWQQPRRLIPGLLLLITLALLAGYALRLHRIGVKEIWWDEAHSWWYAAMPLIQGIRVGMAAWHGAAGDPLFTIILHTWITLVGDSALAMRYLSTLFNLLTIAYLARITARNFGWKAGAIAVLIGVAAPEWVFYSQEVRQYSLTPLLMLIIVDAVIELGGGGKGLPAAAKAASAPSQTAWPFGLHEGANRGIRDSGSAMGGEISPWIKLVIGEVLALYTHSFMTFGMVGVNLLLAWIGVRAFLKDRSSGIRWLRNWVISQITTAVILIPTYRNYLLRAQAGHNPFTQPVRLPDILQAQWGFFTGIPWERVTNDPVLWALSIAILVLIVPGLVIGISRRNRQFANLLWLVAGITAITIVYWMVNPIFHPRYLIYLTGPFLMVLAVILGQTWGQPVWGRPFSVMLGTALVAISAMNLNYLYRGEVWGYSHDQPGSTARILRQQFDANDGIISIDGNDFALEYHNIGEAELFRAGLYEGISTPAEVMDFLKDKDRIALVSFHAQRSDTRNLLPFYLERYGSLVGEQSLGGYVIYTYQMDQGAQPELVELGPSNLDWGELKTTGISIETGDAVTVAVEFEAGASLDETRYAAIINLVDPETNWTLATTTNLLYDDIGYPTSEWQLGQKATQYYVLPLWPGTPPVEAEVQITLVDSGTGRAVDLRDAGGAPAGQQGVLGVVIPGPAPEKWTYGDQVPFDWLPVDSQSISAYATDWPTTAPGGSIGLTLFWFRPVEQLGDIVIELVQRDTVIARQEGPPLQGLPTAEGPPWLDRRVLQVSGEAANGPADLIMRLGNERIVLGTIDVLGFQRLIERPTVETEFEATFGDGIQLLGYRLDVPDPLTAASTLNLTLYWEALSDGTPGSDYTVFTQILNADGQLVGQHDSIPVFGTRPVSGWIAGEYLIDEHPITFKEPYTGPIRVQIGLYDPATFERLLTQDGHDAVILPLDLEVVSNERID